VLAEQRGGVMRVQRLVMPDEAESWTVLGDDGVPVVSIESFLAHLQALDRSPTTVRSYAISLKLWAEFLAQVGTEVEAARVEHVSRFVAWLRAPAANVTVLDDAAACRCAATVNRHLAALFAFYDYQARNGVVLAQQLIAWRRVNRGGYRPFLHHVTAGRPVPTRPLRLRQPRRLPRTLTGEQILALVEGCEHLRDRFLMVLLSETGLRIGQALGLRHVDFVSHRRELHIVPRRDNANGRGQRRWSRRRSRSRRGWSGFTPATCSTSTARSAPTTCSSICSPSPTARRCATRR